MRPASATDNFAPRACRRKPSLLRRRFADEAIGSLAEQLATLCAAVGAVRPQVRYAARAHPVARAFAESLHIELAKAAAGEDEHKRGGVASVLVLERGMDLTS